NIYFHAVHHSIPTVTKDELCASFNDVNPSASVMALRYAIWAHAAMRCKAYSHLMASCYKRARSCLDQVEWESPGEFATITTLQAYILVALFEFKHTVFTRAWVSVSRATWLARLLDLDKMDAGKPPSPSSNSHAPSALESPAEAARRRRTFWAVFTLDALVRVGVGWSPHVGFDYLEISTFLPTDDSWNSELPADAMTLSEALALPATGKLTPYQGSIVAVALCHKCLCHVNSAQQDNSLSYGRYDFWCHHQRLANELQTAKQCPLAHFESSKFAADSNVLAIQVMLEASEICVHRAAISKEESVGGPTFLTAESDKRCMDAIRNIVAVMHNMRDVAVGKVRSSTISSAIS
ncbi:hypothetical protein C8A03DRAFT_17356, partial [Achaetomium macrosporum]